MMRYIFLLFIGLNYVTGKLNQEADFLKISTRSLFSEDCDEEVHEKNRASTKIGWENMAASSYIQVTGQLLLRNFHIIYHCDIY